MNQKIYLRAVRHLSRHYAGRSPKLLTDEEIRSYFVHLKVKRKLARQTVIEPSTGLPHRF